MNDLEIRSIVSKIQQNPNIPVKPRGLTQTDLLTELANEMRRHEQLKYPNPPYQCMYKQVEVAGKNMQVTYVKYDGSQLTETQLAHMRAHSILIRKLSIIAGILNALQFSDRYLTTHPVQKMKIEALMKRLADKAIADVEHQKNASLRSLKEGDELNNFIDTLTTEIQDITGNNEKNVIRQIRKAERYFVADYNKERIIINEINMPGEKPVVQMDIPFANKITDRQKRELMAIHRVDTSERPEWFNLLSDWEKKWFLEKIPTEIDDMPKWLKFENLFQSSAMTHIPGIKNARMNYLVLKDNADKTFVASRSFKMSTMLPYEMPERSRGEGVEQTAKQVLSKLASESRENFSTHWGNLRLSVKPLIVCQGLLSDTIFGGNDNSLMNEQRLAINKQRDKQQFLPFNILSANDPVNFLRYVAAEQGIISRMVGRWSHVDEILNYSVAFQAELTNKKHQLSATQLSRLNLIKAAHAELEAIHRTTHFPRMDKNFAAYKTAYVGILVEALGGVVSTNCKSGKDRTGLDELYRNTMYQHYAKYGKLPSYNGTDEEAAKFAALYNTNFNSMKIQEAAAANTPGSFGIKDDAMMMCRYIAKFLGLTYVCSNLRAAINKPQAFTRDESAEAAELRQRDKESKRVKPYMPPVRMADPKPKQWHALAEQRQKILMIMASLDEYIHDPTSGNKKSASDLYRVLDHMNKRIQQAEAITNEYTEAKLNALLANVATSYQNAIDEFTRNRVKRFVGEITGKKARYDNILDNARLPLSEPSTKRVK